MDKFVVFVVLMVLSNHMVLYANAIHPRTRLVFLQPVTAAQTNSVQYLEQGNVRASKPQALAQQAAPPVDPTNFKLQFVDSIFQIPIATLKAVNALVQTITNNFVVGTTGTVSSPSRASVVLDSSAHSSSPVGVTGGGTGGTSSNSIRSTSDTGKPAAQSSSPAVVAVAASVPVAASTPAATSTPASTPVSTTASSTTPRSTGNKGATPSGQVPGVTQ